ncbi:CDP-glycerol glycerophosphotransferase family protein [bacterium]|nr:CDP-glycerol glycerophosphotransferase family protein [bacterium]
MNFLEATVCAMTTPGLDVLRIKRSKGVRHYAHLVHAPADFGKYKLFSFDYYDSVFVSGEHQAKSLRSLETYRGTHSKQIYNIGCLYYDELTKTLSNKKTDCSNSHPTILVAPTWGSNGLLSKYGIDLLKPLLKSGYHIILRPHPQSYISETDILEDLNNSLQDFKNLTWNRDVNGLDVMSRADILISDISGIIFDFAFLFYKPVITLKFAVEKGGTEANDLPHDAWELGILDVIGKQVSESDIPMIEKIITKLLSSSIQEDKIRALRNKSMYNFGSAASLAADHLIKLVQSTIND